MPYRRRNYRKRTTKKRSYRRRFRRTYRYNKRGQKVYLFKRHCDFGELTIANNVDTLQAYNFSLQDVPDFDEFTALYDCYKINAIKIMFIPQQTQSVSIGNINNPNASSRFFSAIDYNDDSPVTIQEIRQYQSCKMTPILRTHKRYFKPRIQDRGATYTPGRPWINTSSPDQNYFGLKVAVEPMDSTNTLEMKYTVEVKFYMSFKSVK